VTLLGCLKTRSQLKQSGSSGRLEEKQQTAVQQQAQQNLQMDELAEELRAMNGRIEILETELRQKKQGLETGELDPIESINDKLRLYEQALLKLEESVLALQAQVTSASQPSKKKPDPQKKGNFASAQQSFASKQWKDAIFSYQKYRDLNPKGRNYAEATYKMGVSFQELGMSGEAKTFYSEVVEKFPKTSYGKKAKYRLKHLK
jgi:TolA-binding protein